MTAAAAVIHEYDRTVVVRVHTRVYDDGTAPAPAEEKPKPKPKAKKR